MASHLALMKVNHINAITDGYADTVSHFRDRLGFQLNAEIPDQGDAVEACLMTLGGVIFEFFMPKERGERGQGRLLDRFGDHYLGIEYQVPDVAAARQVCVDQDVRIINDPGDYFFTYPGSCVGISFEIWSGEFHAPQGNDRFDDVRPASYWREEHPLGILGLARLSVATHDLDAAVETLQRLTGAAVVDQVARPHAVATGTQLLLGDAIFEVLTPTGDGPVADYLARYGERIRSTVFRVADLATVEAHLERQGFTLEPGDADDARAIAPEQNKHLLFEFTE
jgi:catechol 2,3-dioxygenase-like lactoylglutathione lyase family enzyme